MVSVSFLCSKSRFAFSVGGFAENDTHIGTSVVWKLLAMASSFCNAVCGPPAAAVAGAGGADVVRGAGIEEGIGRNSALAAVEVEDARLDNEAAADGGASFPAARRGRTGSAQRSVCETTAWRRADAAVVGCVVGCARGGVCFVVALRSILCTLCRNLVLVLCGGLLEAQVLASLTLK